MLIISQGCSNGPSVRSPGRRHSDLEIVRAPPEFSVLPHKDVIFDKMGISLKPLEETVYILLAESSRTKHQYLKKIVGYWLTGSCLQ